MGLIFVLLFASVLGQNEKFRNSQDVPNDDTPLTETERDENFRVFNEEWEKYMTDFDFTDMLSFEITAGSKRTFNEKIEAIPTLFRGIYAVSTDDSYKLVVNVYDPTGKILLTKRRVKDAIIYLQLNKTGIYTIEFINNNVLYLLYISSMLRKRCSYIIKSKIWTRVVQQQVKAFVETQHINQ